MIKAHIFADYFFSYLEPPVEEMESNDKEAVDDGFESFDSEDFEDAGQVFSNFSCMFLNPKIFSNLNSNCSNLLDLITSRNKFKKHSEIVLVISKFLQILGLQPRISKVFLDH